MRVVLGDDKVKIRAGTPCWLVPLTEQSLNFKHYWSQACKERRNEHRRIFYINSENEIKESIEVVPKILNGSHLALLCSR